MTRNGYTNCSSKTGWISTPKRNCRTHRFDAPVPMHKVCQHMQNTIAQHQQRREKVTWKPSVTCRAHFEQDSTAKQRRLRPSRARAYFSPQRNLRLPVKTMFRANPNIQIASMMKQFPMRSAKNKNDLQNAIQSQDTSGD